MLFIKPTCYCNQVRVTDVDYVVPRERLRVFLVRVRHQRPDAGPRRQDVTTTHRDVRTQIVFDFTENELNLFFFRLREVGQLTAIVSRSCDGRLLPGQEEDDATVRRAGVEEAHAVGE